MEALNTKKPVYSLTRTFGRMKNLEFFNDLVKNGFMNYLDDKFINQLINEGELPKHPNSYPNETIRITKKILIEYDKFNNL